MRAEGMMGARDMDGPSRVYFGYEKEDKMKTENN